jgi:hypothetical protein
MKVEKVESPKGQLSRVALGEGERINRASDFLDLMVNCPSQTIVLDGDALSEAFFDLRSGLAGDILQKVSNYRYRLVILGDYGRVASKALGDFIRESNATGKVVFADDLEGAVALLK